MKYKANKIRLTLRCLLYILEVISQAFLIQFSSASSFTAKIDEIKWLASNFTKPPWSIDLFQSLMNSPSYLSFGKTPIFFPCCKVKISFSNLNLKERAVQLHCDSSWVFQLLLWEKFSPSRLSHDLWTCTLESSRSLCHLQLV